MILLAPSGAWVVLPSSRVSVINSSDLVVRGRNGVGVIRRALRDGTELTEGGYESLQEKGLISTLFASALREVYLPTSYAELEVSWLLKIFESELDVECARILDVCCGHGRLTLPLLRRGWQVDGVDIDESSIESLRSELTASSSFAPSSVYVADVSNFANVGVYHAAYSAANSIRYLGSLSRVRRHLKLMSISLRDGGFYIVHTAIGAAPGAHRWKASNGHTVQWKTAEVNSLTSESVEDVTIWNDRDSEVARDLQTQFYILPSFLKAAAEESGFAIEAAWNGELQEADPGALDSFFGNYYVLLRKGAA